MNITIKFSLDNSAYQRVRDEYLACGDIESAMDCIMDELGLEPDYAEDLIF